MKIYLVFMFFVFLLDIAARLDVLRKGSREYSSLMEAVSIIVSICILLWTTVIFVGMPR